MDTARIGVATAKAMDRIELLVARGDIPEDAVVGACLLVVALDSPTPEEAREEYYGTTTRTFVFCEPDVVYVQEGLITLAHSHRGDPED